MTNEERARDTTLLDLYKQIKTIGQRFNTWEIPMDKEIKLTLNKDNTIKVEVIMTTKEKARELARKYQGTMTDAQYLSMFNALEEMAEWKEQQMIDKACEFLYKYNQKQVQKHGAKATLGCVEYTINVDDFKKAMRE